MIVLIDVNSFFVFLFLGGFGLFCVFLIGSVETFLMERKNLSFQKIILGMYYKLLVLRGC